ncbi:hypothetical protein ACWKSP_30000 [Micromonosporaceae bacterium Da 78-11]
MENFRPPTTAVTPGLDRLPALTESLGALFAGVLVVGLLALTVLIRRRREGAVWAYALCPGVGLVIIVVNPYGNEGIFRAILFGLPWLAVLAAQVFRPVGFRRGAVPLLAVALALTTTNLVASSAMDATNVVHPADRAALGRFQASNPGSDDPTYLLVLGLGSDLQASAPTPTRLHVVKRDTIDDTGFVLAGVPADTVARDLTGKLLSFVGGDVQAGHAYALWSPISQYYGWAYGVYTREQFADLRDAFARSPSWRVSYTADGSVLFEYTGVRP